MNHAVDCSRLAFARHNAARTWSVSLLFLLAMLAIPAFAVQPIQPGQSQKSFLAQPVVTPALQVLPDAGATTTLMRGANQKPGVDAFLSRAGGEWEMRWDARAGRPNLVQGSGVPLIPGEGNKLKPADIGMASGQAVDMAKLEQLLRGFADRNTDLLGTKGMEFRLDAESSVPYGDGTTHWFVQFDQYYQGVKVDDAYLYFRLSHGNIVQFGAYRVAPVNVDITPALAREDAFNAAFVQMPFRDGAQLDKVIEPGELLIVPTTANQQPLGVSYAGADGQGYGHRLVWRFVFRLHNDTSTYEVLFDAHSNQLLQVKNLTVNVEATVTGGIYPVSNLDPEINVALPFVDVQNNGTQTTDLDGHYNYTGGSASADLGGKYYDINDNCGSLSLSDSSTGNLDFGTSGGTDCITPGVGGAGNTHASRSAFYHLTLINRNADTYYPANGWLDGNVGVNVNINDQCNAFWNGFSLNFFKSGGGCSNTGELAGVFLHEWGHGFDSNTGGSASENGSGEAVGDTFAFIYTADACIGTGFFIGGECHNCNTGCSGVRDVSAFSTRGPPGNSIAMPSTVLDPNGIDAPTECPYFTPSGQPYQGPMGYEGHRESHIASAANWDLAQNLIDEYGAEDGWAEMNRIWYGSLVPSKSAYQITDGGRCNVNAEIDGCGANNWYTVFLAADDDDGNLANGTPNACRIWDAYEAHGIACGIRPVCTGGAEPGFTIGVIDPDQVMCAPGMAAYNIDVGSVMSFTTPVTLSVSGLPGGLSASFSVNPVTPGNSTVLTLTGDATLLAGDYSMTVNGTATGADPEAADITLDVSAGAPAVPVLSGPADGAIGTPTSPTLSWQVVAGADSYTLEVATDAAFSNIVATQNGLTATSTIVPGLSPTTTYFWRVTAINACGSSAPSAAFSFTTANIICSIPNAAIPDGSASGITDSIVITDPAILAGLTVSIEAEHTWVGDLSFSLSNGTSTVVLMDRPGVPDSTFGCDVGNVDVEFSDFGTGPVESACNPSPPAISGLLIPEQPLNANFAGQTLQGTWTLTAADNANGDTGTLNQWCLIPGTGTPPPTYTVGGTVSGLTGTGLELQLNGVQDLGIAANGSFEFSSGLLDGTNYAVTVSTQPTSPVQECTVANGSGTIAGANVTNVAITCTTPPPPSYLILGNVSGLTGDGLVLQLNGGQDLAISDNGFFMFATGVPDGQPYAVTVLSQPGGQTCSVINGSGTVDGQNVSDVQVACGAGVTYTVGGTVGGMTGSGLVLQLNGGNDLAIAADGSFTFPGGLADGSSYTVTVLTQPSGPDNVCTVANGSGTISGANVTNVAVSCVDAASDLIFADGFELPPPDLFTVGGNVSGMTGTGLQLQLNATESLAVGENGPFTFSTGLSNGASYAVTVLTQPTAQTCTVANGSGTIGGANVTNVAVTCIDTPPFTQPIQDPGFEATTGGEGGSNPFWTGVDSEDPSGTPFYTNTPNNGSYSIWFGGWNATGVSSSSASQDVMIASGGPRYIHYWRNIAAAPAGVTQLVISIDGTPVSTVDLTAAGVDTGYTEFVVDISAHADGATHTLELAYSHDGGGSGDDGNTFIDDVTVEETP